MASCPLCRGVSIPADRFDRVMSLHRHLGRAALASASGQGNSPGSPAGLGPGQARGSGSPVVAAAGAAGHSGQALVLGTACLRGAGDYLVAMLVSSCVVRGGELIVEASVKMAGKARARRAARS